MADMEVIAQKMLLRSLTQSMLVEGIINDQFHSFQPDCVVRTIITYCNSVKCLFIRLTDHIKQSNVDYYQVNSFAHDLYEKTVRTTSGTSGNDNVTSLGLLQDYVQSLFNEGIVNNQFSYALTLKTEDKPDSIINLINSYLDDVEAILSEFSEDMDSPDTDFKRLAAQARKIAERSLGMGAEHMKLACFDLIQACDEMQGKKLSQAVGWTKIEFTRTRNKLEAIVQMEKRIMRLKSKGK